MIIIYVDMVINWIVDIMYKKDVWMGRLGLNNLIFIIMGVVIVIIKVMFWYVGKFDGMVVCVFLVVGLFLDIMIVMEKFIFVIEIN